MTHVRAFLRTTPAAAHLSAAAVMLLWIIKATWLDGVDAPFGWLADLGRVVEGVLSAYIAGYVFFVVFALLPEYRSRVKIADFLFFKIRYLVGDCSALLIEVEKASLQALSFSTVSNLDVEAAFIETPTSYQPPLILNGKQALILDLFFYRKQRSLETIEELFEQGRFLDPTLVALLNRVKGCQLFGMLIPTGLPVLNPDLGSWGPSFFKYLQVCRQLCAWHNENRVPGVAILEPEPLQV